MDSTVELHPLEPFMPEGAWLLMLGSFPPARLRWSMDFFYPNFINDMWRIFGIVFFSDKNHFVIEEQKRFDKPAIVEFLTRRGIALYDTACAVRRTKNTASDKDLEIVRETDLEELLARMPLCTTIAATGEKAAGVVAARFGCSVPKPGTFTTFSHGSREFTFWRMPSSSRAYPMKLEAKAEIYKRLFENYIP